MNLRLSTADQTRLQTALQILLSPLDYPHVNAWRSAVNRSMKELLGADMAMFGIPADGTDLFFSEEYDPQLTTVYPSRLKPLASRFPMWERLVRVRVSTRELTWKGHLSKYYRSTYYNEYIKPNRGFDALSVTIALGGIPGPSTTSMLLFHHDSPHTPSFGERGKNLLHLVLPAFQAGVQSVRQFHAHRAAFTRTLDSLKEGLLLCDLAGRVLHQNSALTTLLAADPGRGHLLQEMTKTARALIGVALVPGRVGEGPVCAPAARSLRTAHAHYRITASYVGGAQIGSDSYVLVALERRTPDLPSESDVRQYFGMTHQEARVALLLARRKTNREIAEALCISAHTARHHTESVLSKLGVPSRREVAAAITAPPPRT